MFLGKIKKDLHLDKNLLILIFFLLQLYLMGEHLMGL